MLSKASTRRVVLVSVLGAISGNVNSETPLGWISHDNPSAYTLSARELEVGLSGFLINDTLDVLDIRNEIIGDTDNLAGDTGDLVGSKIEVQYGLTSFLTAFARTGQHELTTELGIISSATVTDSDSELRTDYLNYGLRWMIYEANSRFSMGGRTALSIEINKFESESDDFDVVISEISLPNLNVFFSEPQTFSVNRLEDDGWSAKLLFSTPLTDSVYASAWGGFGTADARSGTTSSLRGSSIGDLFEQEFDLEEDYLYFGLGLNWLLRPRLPVSINYELTHIQDQSFSSIPSPPSSDLPGFLRAGTSDEDFNHVLDARVSWWFNPQAHISLYGKLFSNQFLGTLPHYNNPLSSSFSDKPYGYIGIQLGLEL